MKIIAVKEVTTVLSKLPDGLYLGVWSGSIITISYEGRNFELTTHYGVKGVGIRVIVKFEKGIPTFELLKLTSHETTTT